MRLSLTTSARALVILVSVMIIVVLAIFNFGSWFFLNRMEKSLERELETRLLAVARIGAEMVANSRFPDFLALGQENSARLIVSPLLEGLPGEVEVQQIFLIDRAWRVLASSDQNLFPAGKEVFYLIEDSMAVEKAWQGEMAASALRVIADARFKTAYAPVRNEAGQIVCLFVAEANAGFFDLISQFRQGLIVGGIASFAVLIILGYFLASAIVLFLRTQENLRRSERLASMGEMAATVAHEIRNPLGIIKNTAEVLQQKYGNKQQPDELFEFIPAEVRRLSRLMNDFLGFARDRELHMKRGDLVKTVRRAVDLMRKDEHSGGVVWQLHSAHDEILAEYDEEAITQVLINLFLNASQALNGNGRVDIHLDDQGKGRERLHLRIEDNGPGLTFAPENIFEPFFTTKSRGSGLGLPVCKQIIEKHRGRISAESQPGQGTTMHVWLPG